MGDMLVMKNRTILLSFTILLISLSFVVQDSYAKVNNPPPVLSPPTPKADGDIDLVWSAGNFGGGTSFLTYFVERSTTGSFSGEETTVSSNQWSSNIFAGSGSKMIQAKFPERESTSDSSIKFRASSDTENFVISRGGSSDDAFPMEYVIAGIVIVAIVVGIGITLSKRKKATPIPVPSPGNVHVTSASADTQFWVCPRCGRDIQMKSGRQFCSSCNVYL